MRYLSVCSGIEAATLAWHNPLGWQPVAFSEIEAFPCAVLAHHYPAVPNWGDMTRFQEWPDAAVDLLVGGTPCQSFSVAGLRGGLADPRGNLALTYLAIADRYRPRWLVWENVPGVLSSGGGRDFGAFLGGLGQLGYGWAYRVLDAQYFGLAQRRRRVFVVGYLGGWAGAAAVLFERHSLQGHPAPRREAGAGVAALTASGTGVGGPDAAHAKAGHLIPSTGDVSHCLNAGGMGRQDYESETLIAHTLRGEGFDASEDGSGRGTPIVPVMAFDPTQITSPGNYSQPRPGDPSHPLAATAHPPVIAFHGAQDPDVSGDVTHPLGRNQGQEACIAFSSKDHGGDASADLAPTLRAMGHDSSHANAGGQLAVAFQERGRADGRSLEIGGDVAYALTSPSGGGRAQERNVVTPQMQVRRLMPSECEALQGFPRDYTLIPWRGKPAAQCPDGPRYKALGNSMAVPVIEWIGRRIEAVDKALRESAA